jgi:hypothetical protein
VDLVLTPRFTPDRLPTQGGRLAYFLPPGFVADADEPTRTLGNGEVAVRLSRYVGNFTAALYGYRGFYKTPLGAQPLGAAMPPTAYQAFHPELAVYGASLRGPAPGGILWLEGGWYDSLDDADGNDPFLPNSSLRYLAGYETQLLSDFNVSGQYYGEKMLQYDEYVASVGGPGAADELRHLFTLRAEKLLHYQLLRLSLFTFYSPTDEDAHVRALAGYKVTDNLEVVLGANFFTGEDASTQFGQFDENDNVYTRLRYSF